jgi:hypothetical protein
LRYGIAEEALIDAEAQIGAEVDHAARLAQSAPLADARTARSHVYA